MVNVFNTKVSINLPTVISVTGADDKTSIEEMQRLSDRFPMLEWGILYYPEKQGIARNPSDEWLAKFVKTNMRKAIHLCGKEVFKQILAYDGRTVGLISQFDRVQVNINAREKIFSDAEVLCVYDILFCRCADRLILQYHDASASIINTWLTVWVERLMERPKDLLQKTISRINILYDASRDRGVSPGEFSAVNLPYHKLCERGYAGGIDPDLVEGVIGNISRLQHMETEEISFKISNNMDYWLDMETKARDKHNKLDLPKIQEMMECIFPR